MIKEIKVKDILVMNYKNRNFDLKYYNDLKKDIIEYGLVNPITVKLIKKKYKLLNGYLRLLVYRELKKETIPCIIAK